MSTPKPGQIRCPTCLRSTPPAAFCTQCGSPIPPSARARPRGMDRDELEERVRRRPGEGGFRRGTPLDESPARVGYVPFQPEPEDALAIRPEDEQGRRGAPPPPGAPETGTFQEPDVWAAPPAPAAQPPNEPGSAAPSEPEPERELEPASYREPEPETPAWAEEDYAEPYDDRPYGEPGDAYAYPYTAADDGRGGGGGGALPVIGFVVLCVMALAVGAVLAGLLGGDDEVGEVTPSPSVTASVEQSVEPSVQESQAPTASAAPATPEPTDGPVAFADGALLTIQPCASNGYREEAVGKPEEPACKVDGSSVETGDIWAFVVFQDTAADDTLRVRLRSNGDVINEQEVVLGSILNECGESCDGLIYGAVYRGLEAGEYELVLHRNGEFADRASFVVEG